MRHSSGYRFFWLLIFVGAFLFIGCTGSFPSPSASLSGGTLVPASTLAWSVASPTYSLTLHPTWTAASDSNIASQTIQYFADATCAVASGSPVALTSTATTDTFTAVDATTYSYKITTTSSDGEAVVSACSSTLTTDKLACVGDRLTNTPYADGTGTALDPILICTATQMNAIGLNSADWAKNFKLASDIDLSSYTGMQFNMIGNLTTHFTGVFDGNNHTISNFTITNSTTNLTGLFGYVSGAQSVIKNLILTNVNVTAQRSTADIGALVGYMADGTISQCSVSGNIHQIISTNAQIVGGLGGYINGITVTGASSNMTIAADNHAAQAGGLFGYVESSTIANSSATGSFAAGNSSMVTGGLIGYLSNSTVTESYSTGTVRAVASSAIGGLVGTVADATNITKSYSLSPVIGSVFYAGGLIGGLNSSAGYGVTDSYARGSLAGSTGSVGGLIGGISTTGAVIARCYASGLVSTGTSKGALVGEDNNGGSSYGVYTANFWDNTVNAALLAIGSGPAAVGNTGATTAAMQDPTTFSGAGWTNPSWNLSTSSIYLKLGWQ